MSLNLRERLSQSEYGVEFQLLATLNAALFLHVYSTRVARNMVYRFAWTTSLATVGTIRDTRGGCLPSTLSPSDIR